MPGTKRTSKIVSYNEQEDDDDFIPLHDVNKKSRPSKPKDSSTDSKPSKSTTEPPPQKCIVKLSKIVQEEPNLVPEPCEELNITDPLVIDDQMSENNDQSDEIVLKKPEEQDENLSPEYKRTKHDEDDDENSTDAREDTTEKSKPSSINRQHSPTRATTDLVNRRSSAPFGFPTSKINISSPHTSRVGLSRRSATIKPLHPSFTARSVHE